MAATKRINKRAELGTHTLAQGSVTIKFSTIDISGDRQPNPGFYWCQGEATKQSTYYGPAETSQEALENASFELNRAEQAKAHQASQAASHEDLHPATCTLCALPVANSYCIPCAHLQPSREFTQVDGVWHEVKGDYLQAPASHVTHQMDNLISLASCSDWLACEITHKGPSGCVVLVSGWVWGKDSDNPDDAEQVSSDILVTGRWQDVFDTLNCNVLGVDVVGL